LAQRIAAIDPRRLVEAAARPEDDVIS